MYAIWYQNYLVVKAWKARWDMLDRALQAKLVNWAIARRIAACNQVDIEEILYYWPSK